MPNMKPIMLSEDLYKNTQALSATELSEALQREAALLTPVVTQMTYAMGGSYTSVNFPMLALTEGLGKSRPLDNYEYKYPVMGRPQVSTKLAATVAGTKIGMGGVPFKIRTVDSFLRKGEEVIINRGNYIIKVQSTVPVQLAPNMYEYTVTFLGTSSGAYIPSGVLVKDTILAPSTYTAAKEDSSGTSGRNGHYNGMAANAVSFVRDSFKMTGNVDGKVMKYVIDIDGKKFTSFLDWNLFLATCRFNEARELKLWYSRYFKDSNGYILPGFIDLETGKETPSGAGIDDQITNSQTYTELTADKLSKITDDIIYSTGATSPVFDIMTGMGGRKQYYDALLEKLQTLGFTLQASDVFVKGEAASYSLMVGGYFQTLKTAQGATINLVHNGMFDHGALAATSGGVYPNSNLPLSSYDIYFIDRSNYNGEANIIYGYEKGREYQQYAVTGNIVPQGWSKDKVRSHNIDNCTIEQSCSQGIEIRNTSACFKLKIAA